MTRKRKYTRLPPEVRFWKYVAKSDGCWLWTASTNHWGYGQLSCPGRSYLRAHRLSYEMHVGPIPDGLFVCHRCDVPACVRPDHLFLGTPKDNVDDMVAKGRHRPVDRSDCKRGHPFTEKRRESDGCRVCWVCRTNTQRERRARKRAMVA